MYSNKINTIFNFTTFTRTQTQLDREGGAGVEGVKHPCAACWLYVVGQFDVMHTILSICRNFVVANGFMSSIMGQTNYAATAAAAAVPASSSSATVAAATATATAVAMLGTSGAVGYYGTAAPVLPPTGSLLPAKDNNAHRIPLVNYADIEDHHQQQQLQQQQLQQAHPPQLPLSNCPEQQQRRRRFIPPPTLINTC